MGLVFTDDQIKTMTKEQIELPYVINNPNPPDPTNNPAFPPGLVQQQADIQLQKDAIYATDQQNKVFSDFFLNVINSYHSELTSIVAKTRTLYDVNNIDAGGRQVAPHYPDTWFNLVPQLLAENNGNPVNTGTVTEQSKIDLVSQSISIIKTGFTSSTPYSGTLNADYVAGSGVIELGGATINEGDTVLITNATNFLLGTIGAVGGYCTPASNPNTQAQCTLDGGVWTPTQAFTPISPDINMSAGDNIQNTHSGYTNSDRGYQLGWLGEPFQTYLENQISNDMTNYVNYITNQKLIVDGNQDNDATRVATNTNESSLLQNVIDANTDWSDDVVIDANGKYTDTGLAKLENQLSARTTRIPTRESELNTNLGSIAQAADGSTTGSGAYFNLWEWLLIRISKSGGTLVGWYGIDLGVKHFDTKIANANSTLSQYNNTFAIALISSDTIINQVTFTVDDASQFSTGDSVKVMDNDSIIYSRVISNVLANDITLDSPIPVVLTKGSMARIVRQK